MGSAKLEGGNQNDKRAAVGIQESLSIDIQSSVHEKEFNNRYGKKKKGYEESQSKLGFDRVHTSTYGYTLDSGSVISSA